MSELASHEYRTLKEESEGIFKEKGSKFLAYARSAYSEDEAREYIEQVKRSHHKARHHCYAYRIGNREITERSQDDGEPSGTAGRPILGQLHAFELTNTVVVVVRYFGGTKLGTGGLIQAYKAAARDALANGEVWVRAELAHFKLTTDYYHAHAVMEVLKKLDVFLEKHEYETQAYFYIAMPPAETEDTLERIVAGAYGIPVEMVKDFEAPGWAVQALGIY
jgi:uncharacterized YigZ family protein